MEVFISYSHKDTQFIEVFKEGLNSHLFTSSKYEFGTWEDSKIHVGSIWDEEIKNYLACSDIAILCVSSGFLNSRYIKEQEFEFLIKKFPNTLIIPIYFNHCNINSWDELSRRQFFKPSGEKYDKGLKDDFAFCDLIAFRQTDGKMIPNSNIELYFGDLVKKIEDSVEKKKYELVKKENYNFVSTIRMFPKPSRHFTGRRNELKMFDEVFLNSNICCVAGLGGIGKSEFISKYLESIDVNKVVWFDAKNTSSFENLIESSGFSSILQSETLEKLKLFLWYRELIEKEQKIIVIDDFQELIDSSFVNFFQFLRNSLQNAKFIVISRERLIIENVDVSNFILEGLKDDSLEYAIKIIQHNFPSVLNLGTEKIAEICDCLLGHPFAIQLSFQLLSYEDNAENIFSIIKNYKKESDRLSRRLLDEIFEHPKSTLSEKNLLLNFSIIRGKAQKEVFPFLFKYDYREPLKGLIDKLMLIYHDGFYSLHPLVREFSKLKVTESDVIHKSALEYYLNESNTNFSLEILEEIYYHIKNSQSFEVALEFIVNNSEKLYNHGYYNYSLSVIEFLIEHNYISQKLIIVYTDLGSVVGESRRVLLDRIRKVYEIPNQSEEIFLEAKITELELQISLGEVENPIVKLNELVNLSKKLGYKKGESVCYSNIASFYIDCNKLDLAESNALLGMKTLVGVDYYVGHQFARKILANVYYYRKKYLKAKAVYDKILENAMLVGNNRDIIVAENGLANLYYSKKDFNEALKIYYNVVNKATEIGNKDEEAVFCYNIANILCELKDDKFWSYLTRAIDIHSFIENYISLARCYELGAIWNYDKKHYSECIKYLLTSLSYTNRVKAVDSKLISFFRLIKNDIGLDKYLQEVREEFSNLDTSLSVFIDIEEVYFQPIVQLKKQGRNERCNCGSGKKYKDCHGKQ